MVDAALIMFTKLSLQKVPSDARRLVSSRSMIWTGSALFSLLFLTTITPLSARQCQVKGDAWKFDCFPQGHPTQAECEARGCCWRHGQGKFSESQGDVPVCFYPTNYASYIVKDVQKNEDGAQLSLTMHRPSPYPRNIQNVLVQFKYISASVLSIKIVDADHQRWEPSLLNNSVLPSGSEAQTLHASKTFDGVPENKTSYKIFLPSKGQPFNFKVSRKSGDMLMETTGGFTFSDQFLQLSTYLPSPFLYGLGEHRQRLMVNTSSWTKFTMWNRDHPPKENTNLYGSHPVYLSKDAGGWHAVFLHNSNAMDVIVQPALALTWRPIGGIFHFYVMLGKSPADVMSQYAGLVGTTFMPPFWALGFHLCWQEYGTAANTLATVERMRRLGIPQDVQWNDSDYADGAKVFTTDYKHFGDQPELARKIHSRGLHYIIIVDCGISNSAQPGSYEPYDLGQALGLFINGSDQKPLVGKVWPGTTVWPDFVASNQTQNYWTKIAADFHTKVPFDGMWLDMNEISSFVDGSVHGCDNTSRYNAPPYLPGVADGSLYSHTICPSALHGKFPNYNVHNLYGMAETATSFRTLKEVRGKRPFIISRSTFPGQGHYGGHWSGDNSATFYDMYKSISAMLHANMFGIPVTGSDICGFHLNASQELCTRWHQLGAFYGFSRNHNAYDCLPQDPGQFDAQSVASTRKALLVRYSLLPYLYTLMWRSHVYGETVARPLVFEFPDDVATHNLDRQFLWGAALLISPVLTEGARTLEAYFPKGVWYDFYTGQKMSIDYGQFVTLKAPLDHVNLHVRGGHVLAMQEPALTTTVSRKNPFWLLVSLDSNHTAEGQLFWDDGDSIDTYEQGDYVLTSFKAKKGDFTSTPEHAGSLAEPMTLDNVTVVGLSFTPTAVMLDGRPLKFSFVNSVLYILSINVSLTQPFEITWR